MRADVFPAVGCSGSCDHTPLLETRGTSLPLLTLKRQTRRCSAGAESLDDSLQRLRIRGQRSSKHSFSPYVSDSSPAEQIHALSPDGIGPSPGGSGFWLCCRRCWKQEDIKQTLWDLNPFHMCSSPTLMKFSNTQKQWLHHPVIEGVKISWLGKLQLNRQPKWWSLSSRWRPESWSCQRGTTEGKSWNQRDL